MYPKYPKESLYTVTGQLILWQRLSLKQLLKYRSSGVLFFLFTAVMITLYIHIYRENPDSVRFLNNHNRVMFLYDKMTIVKEFTLGLQDYASYFVWIIGN